MGMPVNTPRAWRFGVFELDASSGELRRNGTVVRLREQPARILLLLLENAGQMVTREQLRQHLWPSDTFVDFDHSLNSAIMKLREALGDSADKPLYIETIPERLSFRRSRFPARRYAEWLLDSIDCEIRAACIQQGGTEQWQH